MSQVFIDGKYHGCTQAQLGEMDQLAAEKKTTREVAAAQVLGIKPAKKAAKGSK